MVKNLLRLRIKYLIKKAFQKAETVYRLGNGEQKLNYAVDFIAKKTLMLPCFKNLLKEILLNEFENHAEHINKMIIRKPIRI